MVIAVSFAERANFLESVFNNFLRKTIGYNLRIFSTTFYSDFGVFHHDMWFFFANNGLDQHVCIVNTIFLIKKLCVNLFWISFYYDFLKSTSNMTLIIL